MYRIQNSRGTQRTAPAAVQTPAGAMDWSQEISGTAGSQPMPADQHMASNAGRPMDGLQVSDGQLPPGSTMDIRNGLPSEVITDPLTVEEAYRGSLKAMLAKYVGTYIVATFLVGTQNTVSWEGVLYDVGNDYMTIYQQGRDRYIVSDIYSLKFIEFYDTSRRELCDQILAERNWEQMG